VKRGSPGLSVSRLKLEMSAFVRDGSGCYYTAHQTWQKRLFFLLGKRQPAANSRVLNAQKEKRKGKQKKAREDCFKGEAQFL
jgi:hypothetical protein